MNIRDLKYLVAVVESEHFGQAAEQCCVSQPTLSMQLKKLEDELGVQLFERNNKCVMTTPIGKQLAEQAKRILGEINTLKNIASNSKDPCSGDFHLGIIPTMGPYLLPQLLSALKKHLTKLNLIVFENKTENILKELHSGLLDAVILALPVEKEGLVCHELFREEFILALPKDHLLTKKNKVNLSDIRHEELLLLEDGHCLREQIMDACHMLSSQEKTGFKATSLETLKHLVASGLGVTLLPEMMVEKSAKNSGQVVFKHFAKPAPSRKVAILWRKNSARMVCCEKLWKLFGE
ncbi:MAG: LysR substrate-binding domain-containing protein [Gammaproteobacteria bacterium]|nr:LysR substrate-binding domain-containing protein [Gammaproteobacteria bacterium]